MPGYDDYGGCDADEPMLDCHRPIKRTLVLFVPFILSIIFCLCPS